MPDEVENRPECISQLLQHHCASRGSCAPSGASSPRPWLKHSGEVSCLPRQEKIKDTFSSWLESCFLSSSTNQNQCYLAQALSSHGAETVVEQRPGKHKGVLCEEDFYLIPLLEDFSKGQEQSNHRFFATYILFTEWKCCDIFLFTLHGLFLFTNSTLLRLIMQKATFKRFTAFKLNIWISWAIRPQQFS